MKCIFSLSKALILSDLPLTGPLYSTVALKDVNTRLENLTRYRLFHLLSRLLRVDVKNRAKATLLSTTHIMAHVSTALSAGSGNKQIEAQVGITLSNLPLLLSDMRVLFTGTENISSLGKRLWLDTLCFSLELVGVGRRAAGTRSNITAKAHY